MRPEVAALTDKRNPRAAGLLKNSHYRRRDSGTARFAAVGRARRRLGRAPNVVNREFPSQNLEPMQHSSIRRFRRGRAVLAKVQSAHTKVALL